MPTFTAQPAEGETPPPDAVHPRDSTPDAPTSVLRLGETIKGFIQGWGSVWVEGEITSWNVRGGHVYGRLTDASGEASIDIRLWSSVRQRSFGARFPEPGVGDHVVACVKADYFVKAGQLSFTVSQVRPVGLGEQLERLERLRAQLRSEGLFDESRKKPIPFLPHVVGLITGENSDAEKDVLRNAQLRWPQVRFRTVHAAVQGERSAPEVIQALALLDADPDVDVIVIARGGGDPQHLVSFSDERLLRAVAAAGTPVVSAIGHENDHPLLDDVADLRASTPTDAAKRVVPDVSEQRALVGQLRERAYRRVAQRIAHDAAQLEQLRSRPVLRAPERMLTERAHEIVLLGARSRTVVDRAVAGAERSLAGLRASLAALGPQATLDRGYAVVQTAGGGVVRSPADAPAGAGLLVTLADGAIAATSHGDASLG